MCRKLKNQVDDWSIKMKRIMRQLLIASFRLYTPWLHVNSFLMIDDHTFRIIGTQFDRINDKLQLHKIPA